MARTLPTQREKFDPSREFSVVKPFRCDGIEFAAGSAFPNTTVTTRKLRQLFEQKFIAMEPERFEGDDEITSLLRPHAGAPDFSVMSMDQLRDYLRQQGTTPRYGWDRGQLLAKIAEAA